MNPPAWIIVLAASSLTFLTAAWLLSFCRFSAAWHHLGWLLALVIPVFSLAVVPTGWRVELPVLPADQPVEIPVLARPVFAAAVPPSETFSAPNAMVAPPAGLTVTAEQVVGALWVLGCLMVMGYLAISHFRLRQKLRRVRPATIPERILGAFTSAREQSGLRAELLLCDFTGVPFCYGLLRPCIVFPRLAAEWSDEMIRACLAHEFAHLRRRDLISLAVAQIGCAVLWFNPLAWFGLSRLRAAAESAADDLAIEQPSVFETYASQLIAVAAHARGSLFAAATFPMARTGQLRRRIDALMDEKRRRKAPGLWSVVSLTSVLLTVLAASLTVELVAAEPEPNGSPTEKMDNAPSVPPIMVACEGEFRTEDGRVIATGNVRLSWRGLRAQADRLDYDLNMGVIRLSPKKNSADKWERFFLLTLRDAGSDSSISPRIERQANLPITLNPAKGPPDLGLAGPVVIEGEDNGDFKDGLATATRNAMLSQFDVTVGADRLEYIPKNNFSRLYEKSATDDYQLIATVVLFIVKKEVSDLAKKYITAVQQGDEETLRQLLGAEIIPELPEARRREVENSWVQQALKLRSTLSMPPDSYTIQVTPWDQARMQVEPPLYWPIKPSYYIQILGKGSSVGIAICLPARDQMVIMQPLASESATVISEFDNAASPAAGLLGISQSDLVSKRGTPQQILGPTDGFQTYEYPDGLAAVVHQGKVVQCIARKPSTYQTDKGIGLGADLSDVTRAYGQYTSTENVEQWFGGNKQKVLYRHPKFDRYKINYAESDLVFMFDQNKKVESIWVGYIFPRESPEHGG